MTTKNPFASCFPGFFTFVQNDKKIWSKNLSHTSCFPLLETESLVSRPLLGEDLEGVWRGLGWGFTHYSPLSQALSSEIVYNSGHGLYVSALKYTLSLEASTCLLYLNLHNAFFRFSSNSAVQHLPAHFSLRER